MVVRMWERVRYRHDIKGKMLQSKENFFLVLNTPPSSSLWDGEGKLSVHLRALKSNRRRRKYATAFIFPKYYLGKLPSRVKSQWTYTNSFSPPLNFNWRVQWCDLILGYPSHQGYCSVFSSFLVGLFRIKLQWVPTPETLLSTHGRRRSGTRVFQCVWVTIKNIFSLKLIL